MGWFNFKKVSLLLFPLLLCSCTNAEIEYDDRIMLESEANITSFKLIEDLSILNNKIVNDETFLLYVYSHSCSACPIYEPMITNYIVNNEVVIYAIDVANENTSLRPDNGLIDYLETPSLFLYNRGEIVFKASPNTYSNAFVSSSGMEKFLEEYVFVSSFIKINNEELLDITISDTDSVLVYYFYEKCGDCTYFDMNYLNRYFYRKDAKKIYAFEMSYYFDNREDSSSPIYKNFTDKYGLSKDGNTTFGYKNGVVPTLQRYRDGKLIDSVIIYNDEFDIEYDTNNEVERITITSSYYSDNDFIGKSFTRTENESALNIYHKETLSYFISKFEKLL